MTYVLAIDQGTSSSRAILFDASLAIKAVAQKPFLQRYPAPGLVEHDPEDIWTSVVDVCREAIARAGIEVSRIAAIGIANQRETTVIWDRATGQPIHRAIVWQDRRTAPRCAALKAEGLEALVAAKSGLLLDPYFSATKIGAILDAVPGARERARRGELAFGTIDTFLLWRLTDGKSHKTDATNASRTSLYNIHAGRWDDDLAALFDVPLALLPAVTNCADAFGTTEKGLFGAEITIRGMVGDQQAAMAGQACFAPGMMKSTYGTGCFALLNTGDEARTSTNRLLTTIACQLDGQATYALEGSIFIAGAALQWLRDDLGILEQASDADRLANAVKGESPVYFVPAFTGLGAPHWDPDARGALFGLTRDTARKDIVRAALEAACFQTLDLIAAMRADWPSANEARTVLRADGGMSASDWTMQRLADLLDAPVERPASTETTALGAAYFAGLSAGICPPPADFMKGWAAERHFAPSMPSHLRAERIAGWRSAVGRTLSAPAYS